MPHVRAFVDYQAAYVNSQRPRLAPSLADSWSDPGRLDGENKRGNKNNSGTGVTIHSPRTGRMRQMVRLARESLAFVSVASFCWMICAVAYHVG